MQDYMMALYKRFPITSSKTVELGREVEAAYDTLHDSLSRKQQRLLLRFVDAENRFHDEEKLDSFFAGFRLAGRYPSGTERDPTVFIRTGR